jgi:hypothetical protein
VPLDDRITIPDLTQRHLRIAEHGVYRHRYERFARAAAQLVVSA